MTPQSRSVLDCAGPPALSPERVIRHPSTDEPTSHSLRIQPARMPSPGLPKRQRTGALQDAAAPSTRPPANKILKPSNIPHLSEDPTFASLADMSDRPGIIDWPHAPPHRLTERGTYFVTASTHHRAHHFRSSERLEVAQRGLLKLAAQYGWDLEAWAVFSNHYHFIAKSPSDPSSLSPMLSELHVKLSSLANKLDHAPGRNVWHNFRETQLTHLTSYFARLNYTHGNAVHHGLVSVAKDYPWCSAAWFEESNSAAIVKSIRRFKTDHLHLEDDFDVAPEW